MTDGEPKLFGGIEHVEGKTVNAVTDPLGPVNIGSGPQYNVHSAFFSGVEFVQRPQRSPRLIAEDWLSELARRFAAPRSFDRLRRKLREPGTLLIAGAAGTGRRTAALLLLRSSGAGANRFRELPDEAGEDSKVVLDLEAIEPGERLLLDLSGEPDRVVGSLRRELVDYHSAVLRAGAYLVVVLPENAEHEVPEELRQLVDRIERPDGGTVLRRHLIANGVELEAGAFDVVGLAQHLESNPMREIAQLASLVDETREAAEGRGTVRDWLAQAISAMSVSLDEVSTQVRENADGRFRALLLASAMFEKMPAEVVFHATERLLGTVEFPDDSTHRLERPDLAENLRRIGASTDSERRVRLKTVTYGGAVRTYFWNCFPGLREDLRGWLDGALRMEIVGHRDRTTVLERFSEQCLRIGYPADLFWLIARWGRDPSSRAPSLLAAASHVLAQGLVDEQFGSLFRRQIYDWSVNRGLPRNLALELVRLCTEAIAPTRPEQALVRLRHLTRNNDRAVSDEARATLVALAAEDDLFLRRVVHRLADDLRRQQPWPTDLTLFTALANPARFITGARPLLSDPWFCSQIVGCWRALMVNRPADQWAELAWWWLETATTGQDLLLDVLVAAAGERGDLHARLYVVARDWVAGDAARRRTAAELLRRGDQAQGLDLHGARPTSVPR